MAQILCDTNTLLLWTFKELISPQLPHQIRNVVVLIQEVSKVSSSALMAKLGIVLLDKFVTRTSHFLTVNGEMAVLSLHQEATEFLFLMVAHVTGAYQRSLKIAIFVLNTTILVMETMMMASVSGLKVRIIACQNSGPNNNIGIFKNFATITCAHAQALVTRLTME